MKYRIYTKVTKIGDDYYEAEYKEIDYTGRQTGYGVEDFSGNRLRTATKLYEVYQHNGRINKAGGRMTDYVGTVRVSKNASGLKAAIKVYGKAARAVRV